MKEELLGIHITQIKLTNKRLGLSEVNSVTNSDGFVKSTDYFSKEVFSKKLSNYKVVKQNQFAYNPSRINVGSIDYLKQESPVVISPLYVVFECKKTLYPNFLLRFLKSPLGNQKIRSKTRGAVRDTLSFKRLSEIKIPLPSFEDQIRIAEVLTKVERLISQRKESINLLDELLKSTFLQMFGDPLRNEKEHPKEPISRFGVCSTGNTPSRKIKEYYSNDFIEWIKTDNILDEGLYVSQSKEYLSEAGSKKGRKVDKGALLVTCIAGSLKSIGRAALTDRPVAFNQQINAIQPFDDVSSIFLYWLFKVGRNYIQNHATKGMKKILSKGEFEKIKLPKPKFSDQKKFENIAFQTEFLMQKLKVSLSELENLYNSLSQKAFKGELDLSKLQIDHIISLSQGGSDDEENLQVVTYKENRRISNKPKTSQVGNAIMENYYEDDINTLLKEHFGSFDFRFSEVIEFFENEKAVALNYLTSEELKRHRNQLELDIKTFIFNCIEGKNPHLKLEQRFINAFEDSELNNLNPRAGRESLLAELNSSPATLEFEDISGIYFRISK
ncbi:MAG: restriction endonuclease subunit S [Algicola sp.]|nr:restriction endonuclease subunit S [Algicola sp.]